MVLGSLASMGLRWRDFVMPLGLVRHLSRKMIDCQRPLSRLICENRRYLWRVGVGLLLWIKFAKKYELALGH